MTRPPELEEFFQRHGKPLEVGMVVSYKDEEYEVEQITRGSITDKINIVISHAVDMSYDEVLPLDLTPIL